MRVNNVESFNDHMLASYDKVRAYARRISHSAQEAEDITQEAFLRAFKAYENFQWNSSFETWVRTIARNYYFDSLARDKRRVETVSLATDQYERVIEQIPDSNLQPDEDVIARDADPVLIAAIKGLSKIQQRIMWMIAVEGYTYAQVAEVLNVPLGTVKSRYSRMVREARLKY